MKKKILLFLLFALGGLIFRIFQYYLFPVYGETYDETAWAHLGASLIQERVPSSWSFFDVYEDGYIYKESVYQAPIVRPVFDPPPLFSFIPGIAHSLKTNWINPPSVKVIRLPLVLLGSINVGLFWLLADKFFKDKKWSILTSILFMTIPTLVFSSRLVVAENLLVTWTILSFLAILNLKKEWSLKVIFFLSAAAVLTKVSGVIIPVSFLAIGFLRKDWKLFKTSLFGMLLGAGFFALYGAVYDWGLFVKLLLTQSNRDLSLVTLQNRLFLNPTVSGHIFFDGWKILGLFSLVFILSKKKKEHFFIKVFSLISLVFILFTVGGTTFHGWYDFVLWPVLIISIGVLLKEIYEKELFLFSGLVWLLLLPLIQLLGASTKTALSLWTMRGIVSVGFLPILFNSLGWKKLSKKSLFVLLAILVIINILVIFSLDMFDYWDYVIFFEEGVVRIK
jgi:hypothetical protein